VVESDPLDEPSEHFLCRRLRIRLHTDRRIPLFRQDAANVTAPCHYESWIRETETEAIASWVVSRGQRIQVSALRADVRFSCLRRLDGFVILRTGPSLQTAPLP